MFCSVFVGMAAIVSLQEKEICQNAEKALSNSLQRTNNLEQIRETQSIWTSKEASGEAMLKTATQTRIDDIRKGVMHLKNALNALAGAKTSYRELEETCSTIPQVSERTRPVREESMKHTQYAAANENSKHSSNVPGNVAKCRNYIAEENLLLAYQSLLELENSREKLLYEIHRLPSTSPADKSTLKHHFSDVEKLSEELGKQLWLIIRLALNYVRKEPAKFVSALRIIECEEKCDAEARERYETTRFMAPGRPKQWRKRVFEILEEAASERIIANQTEERSQNKMWLVRHLEVTRILILEDLKVVKNCQELPCVPKSYDILNKMLRLYHRCLSAHLQELAMSLEGNEYITLLNWVQVYEGPELMKDPVLNFDLKVEGLEPLLPKPLIDDLTNKYLQTIEKNYKEWLNNTINREMKDWSETNQPETDDNGHYQTTTPVIVYQMIDQHLQVAKTVDQRLITRVLVMSLENLTNFAKQYRLAAVKYCESHFEDRGKYKYFTPYMIAVTNNCVNFTDIAWKLRRKYSASSANTDRAFETVLNSFEKLREDMINFLLYELFLDLDKELVKVGTREWFESKASVIENVCLTLDDYLRDYNYLKESNFDYFRNALENKLAKSYITAVLRKKMILRDYSQREQFARKFVREAEVFKNQINKMPNYKTKTDETKKASPFDSLPLLAEILRLKDLSMLFLEVSGLIQRYPDIQVDHLTHLLNLREDMAKNNVRKQVADMMSEVTNIPNNVKTVFSEITLS